jgi:hypothetical protein
LLALKVEGTCCGDVRNMTFPVLYDWRPRSMADFRIRGIEGKMETELLDLLQREVGPVHPSRSMSHLGLLEQFKRVRAASHILAAEGAFLIWLLFARPGTTVLCVYEGWARPDSFHHVHFFYPLLRMRDDVRFVAVLVAHRSAPSPSILLPGTAERQKYGDLLEHVAPQLRYVRDAMKAPIGLHHVTTAGVFSQGELWRG